MEGFGSNVLLRERENEMWIHHEKLLSFVAGFFLLRHIQINHFDPKAPDCIRFPIRIGVERPLTTSIELFVSRLSGRFSSCIAIVLSVHSSSTSTFTLFASWSRFSSIDDGFFLRWWKFSSTSSPYLHRTITFTLLGIRSRLYTATSWYVSWCYDSIHAITVRPLSVNSFISLARAAGTLYTQTCNNLLCRYSLDRPQTWTSCRVYGPVYLKINLASSPHWDRSEIGW